jgi:hypothetical protein
LTRQEANLWAGLIVAMSDEVDMENPFGELPDCLRRARLEQSSKGSSHNSSHIDCDYLMGKELAQAGSSLDVGHMPLQQQQQQEQTPATPVNTVKATHSLADQYICPAT